MLPWTTGVAFLLACYVLNLAQVLLYYNFYFHFVVLIPSEVNIVG